MRSPSADRAEGALAEAGGRRKAWYLIGGGAVLFAVLGTALALHGGFGESFERRVEKVKPGIAMAQASRIMGESERSKPKKITFSIGDTGSDEDRMPDFDRPMDYSGSGYVVYESMMSGVKIHFRDGVVTRVEEVARQGGMRKRTTITQ